MSHGNPMPWALPVPSIDGEAVFVVMLLVIGAHFQKHVLVSLAVNGRVALYGVPIIRGKEFLFTFIIAMAFLLPYGALREKTCVFFLSE